MQLCESGVEAFGNSIHLYNIWFNLVFGAKIIIFYRIAQQILNPDEVGYGLLKSYDHCDCTLHYKMRNSKV